MASLWLRSRLFVKVDEYTDAVLVGLLDEFQALKKRSQPKCRWILTSLHAVPVVHGLLLLSNFTRTISAGFVCADGTVVWMKSSVRAAIALLRFWDRR